LLGSSLLPALGLLQARAGEKGQSVAPVVLPAQVGQWNMEGQEESYGPDTLFDYMDGAAELYLAYNFRSMKVARYSKGEGPRIVLELYQMGSSEDAFGIFSFEREDQEAGVGQGSEMGGGILRFWKGRYFASIYGEADGLEPAIVEVGKALASRIQEVGKPPELMAVLPDASQGLEPASVRFFRNHVCLNQRFFIANKNILQLGPDTGGLLAKLSGPWGKVHLVVVRYPSQERAAAAEASFRSAYMPEAGQQSKVRTEDGRWTGTSRRGDIWIGVFGAKSQEELGRVLEMVLGRLGKA
jgi:hypothetical protein